MLHLPQHVLGQRKSRGPGRFGQGIVNVVGYVADLDHSIGMPFDARPIFLSKGEHRTHAYLAINPEGKVPTLLIDGRPLTEVAAILYYLAKKYPEAKLLPVTGAEEEARAISWMSFIASTLHPARAQGLDKAIAIFALADQRLGQRTWALGPYSIVDIHLFRLYWRFATSLKPPKGSLPNLERHFDLMMARPAVQKTIEIETRTGYDLPA